MFEMEPTDVPQILILSYFTIVFFFFVFLNYSQINLQYYSFFMITEIYNPIFSLLIMSEKMEVSKKLIFVDCKFYF